MKGCSAAGGDAKSKRLGDMKGVEKLNLMVKIQDFFYDPVTIIINSSIFQEAKCKWQAGAKGRSLCASGGNHSKSFAADVAAERKLRQEQRRAVSASCWPWQRPPSFLATNISHASITSIISVSNTSNISSTSHIASTTIISNASIINTSNISNATNTSTPPVPPAPPVPPTPLAQEMAPTPVGR
ncbi:hypothetical protein llap_6485 [Limosa lapponica baueri]|uniref:Uncharacterized protein n=1 Tax=Limosa lapponica baueri TaxID=1758121 RepID=A0A2I0UAW4_LIMLA|nr:hypothetical protein llap_6485 [Limosa lapponica baueri]